MSQNTAAATSFRLYSLMEFNFKDDLANARTVLVPIPPPSLGVAGVQFGPFGCDARYSIGNSFDLTFLETGTVGW